MPLITETFDSLPYIDTDPTPSERAAAEALISSELSSSTTTSHPLLPPLAETTYTPLMTSEFARIESKQPMSGIDLSRYEAQSSSSAASASVLARAYTSSVYLSQRGKNLATLDATGKDEWLAGNEELVKILAGVEKELAEKKEAIDVLAVERRNAQGSVEGEVKGLERTWREGVGRVLETEVEAERIRGLVLERRRGGGV